MPNWEGEIDGYKWVQGSTIKVRPNSEVYSDYCTQTMILIYSHYVLRNSFKYDTTNAIYES